MDGWEDTNRVGEERVMWRLGKRG